MPDALPAEIPVLTLMNTVFFPRTVLPLHIFEPRDREMLGDVLASHRIFAVAALDTEHPSEPKETEPHHRIATAGIIRVCQKNDNGTANLLLEGLTRIEILATVREEPYRLVKARSLPDVTDATPHEIERLRRELLRVIRLRSKLGAALPPELDRAAQNISDPAAVCDLLVFTLIADTIFKQQMLETVDTATRLARAVSRFRHETDLLRLQRRLQGRLDDEDIAHN